MSVPVIDPTTSILGYRQWLYWEYQPYASNTPTSWACSGLPPGMSISATTGRISGAASTPGIYQASLTASNASGASTPLVLTIGIEESTVMTNSAADITIDLATGSVSATGSASSSSEAKAVLYAKEGDDHLLVLRFQKGGANIDLEITSLKMGLKELEPEGLILLGGGTTDGINFKRFGTGSDTYFVLPITFSGDAVASALANYEADSSTAFNALAEIEWIEGTNWAGVGPSALRRTTRSFWVTIERDLVPNA